MTRKNNQLNAQEIWLLTNQVQREDSVFTKWDDAEKHFTKKLGRKVTKANIQSASKACGKDWTELVKIDLSNNPHALALQQVRQLVVRIEELEKRVLKIESK
jgi:hypothetical protein